MKDRKKEEREKTKEMKEKKMHFYLKGNYKSILVSIFLFFFLCVYLKVFNKKTGIIVHILFWLNR